MLLKLAKLPNTAKITLNRISLQTHQHPPLAPIDPQLVPLLEGRIGDPMGHKGWQV